MTDKIPTGGIFILAYILCCECLGYWGIIPIMVNAFFMIKITPLFIINQKKFFANNAVVEDLIPRFGIPLLQPGEECDVTRGRSHYCMGASGSCRRGLHFFLLDK